MKRSRRTKQVVPVVRKVRLFVEIGRSVRNCKRRATADNMRAAAASHGLEVNIADDGVEPNTVVSVCVSDCPFDCLSVSTSVSLLYTTPRVS